jgi:hypothetical protein
MVEGIGGTPSAWSRDTSETGIFHCPLAVSSASINPASASLRSLWLLMPSIFAAWPVR